MIESMREGILQVVAGKGITGAQIRQAMSQSGEENRTVLYELFEYRVSAREIRALEAQLQEFKGFDAEEHTRADKKEERKDIERDKLLLPMDGKGMKVAQIASTTKGALRNELGKTTAFSTPRPDLNNTTVGADNIMQVVELCGMSEYIHETEQKEECEGQTGEMWPDIRNVSTKKRRGMLRMITNVLRAGVHGAVLASRNCNWIKEWAQQWDLKVTHYRYGRKDHSPLTDQDGQQRERLTRVEYTGKVLEQDVHVDHKTVVAQAEQFIADCASREVTDASMAKCVGCTTEEFRRWMTGEQDCVQMERRYDTVIQRLMLDFEAYRIERTGAAAEMMPFEDGASAEMAAEAAEGVSEMIHPDEDEDGQVQRWPLRQ